MKHGDVPQRVQLSRQRGWRIPPNTVVVSRPAAWGNRYRLGRHVVHIDGRGVSPETREQCVELFEEWLRYWVEHVDSRVRDSMFRDLRGKNLACWCAHSHRCHADVLLEYANK